MKAKRVNREEQLKLIMECRSSAFPIISGVKHMGFILAPFTTGLVSYAKPT